MEIEEDHIKENEDVIDKFGFLELKKSTNRLLGVGEVMF